MSTDLLKRRPLGKIHPDVAAISIGCAPLGDMRDTFAYSVTEEQAIATVLTALESPLNYLDTAAHYGDGESERRVGLALQANRRFAERRVPANQGGKGRPGDYSGETVKRRFERSLKLLGVDRFDLVFLHDPEQHDLGERLVDGAAQSRCWSRSGTQGMIGHLGVASGPIDLEMRYVESGNLRCGNHPQPLHAAQPGRRSAARPSPPGRVWRCSMPRHMAAGCWPRAGRLSALRLPGRRGRQVSTRLRGSRRSATGTGAAGRCRAPVLAARPAHHQHDRRDDAVRSGSSRRSTSRTGRFPKPAGRRSRPSRSTPPTSCGSGRPDVHEPREDTRRYAPWSSPTGLGYRHLVGEDQGGTTTHAGRIEPAAGARVAARLVTVRPLWMSVLALVTAGS